VKWSPEGQLFASGSQDNYIKIWDSRSAQKKPSQSVCHYQPVFALSWNSQKTSMLAVGDEEGVKIYDTKKLDVPVSLNVNFGNSVKAIEFSTNFPELLAVGSDDGTTCVLDGTLTKIYNHQHADFVRCVSWNSDSRIPQYIAGGGWDRILAAQGNQNDVLNLALHEIKRG